VSQAGYGQGRNERGAQFPGRQMTAGGAEKSQQCHMYILQYSKFTFERFDLRFEHWGVKLASCPGRHLILLRPWLWAWWNAAPTRSAPLHPWVWHMQRFPAMQSIITWDRTKNLEISVIGYRFMNGRYVGIGPKKPYRSISNYYETTALLPS